MKYTLTRKSGFLKISSTLGGNPSFLAVKPKEETTGTEETVLVSTETADDVEKKAEAVEEKAEAIEVKAEAVEEKAEVAEEPKE